MPLTAVQLKRLEWIQDEKGKQFCDGFIAELLTRETIARLAVSGKISLSENKREKVLSYVVSGLADGAGVFIPTGTLAKAANDLVNFLVNLKRKGRHKLYSKLEANPVHFSLVTLALINALLITYGDQLWTKLSVGKEVGKEGENLAKNIVSLIKDKKVSPTQWGDKSLTALVKGFYQLFQEQVLPLAYKDMPKALEDSLVYEDILLICSAQLIGLPPQYFEKTQEWESQLDELKKKVDELKQAATQEGDKNTALIEIGPGATFGKGAQFFAEKIDTQQQIDASVRQLIEAKKAKLDLANFWGGATPEKKIEKPAEGEQRDTLKRLIFIGPKASFGEDIKITATTVSVQQRLILRNKS